MQASAHIYTLSLVGSESGATDTDEACTVDGVISIWSGDSTTAVRAPRAPGVAGVSAVRRPGTSPGMVAGSGALSSSNCLNASARRRRRRTATTVSSTQPMAAATLPPMAAGTM